MDAVPNSTSGSPSPPPLPAPSVPSLLAFSPTECSALALAFASGAVVGACVQLFVISVFLHKMSRETQKSASDQLFVSLTVIDLAACVLLFPLEVVNFSHKCNIEADFSLAVTMFLEVASTLALLNIAINRFVLVYFPTSQLITFRTSILMTIGGVLLSATITASVVQRKHDLVIATTYILFHFSNFLALLLIYSMIFGRLWYRVRVQAADAAHSATRSRHRSSEMEQMRNRAAAISCIVTLVYIICFLPNGCLTLSYVLMADRFLAEPSAWTITVTKYVQLVYNLNFVLMPLVYAVLSNQFREDCVYIWRHSLIKRPNTRMTQRRSVLTTHA